RSRAKDKSRGCAGTRERVRSSATYRLWFDRLEDRVAPAGLTLITHGFNDDIGGWVTSMADAVAQRIANRFGTDTSDVAEITLTVATDLTVTPAWIPGHQPIDSKSSETI